MQVKIVNISNNPLPAYETLGAAGMDLRAYIPNTLIINPMERIAVPTGLFIELPIGFEAQVRPRSGLALKHGISVPNTPGTIDSDYRGEIKVILINLSNEPFKIESGDRIAQMVIQKYESISWEKVEQLSDSERGAGGFGSTGK
jgi:dUTP pyrophosphatase